MRAPMRKGFLRENAFLAAAIALPIAVVMLFLVATALPRWLVAPPQHDLLIRAHGSYEQTRPRVSVEFAVRNDRVEAIVRGLPADTYAQVPRLYLVEHDTRNVREVPYEVPLTLGPNDPPVRLSIDLKGRRVIADSKSPDGYELRTQSSGSTGIAGDLFGMRSYRHEAALVKSGRVEEISLPVGTSSYSIAAVGWVLR
jgi:hypothetical protein